MVEILFPESFLKNQNWAYLWINSLKVYIVYFYRMPSQGYRNILKQSSRTKRALELVSQLHFLHAFCKKLSFLLYSLDWPNFIVWLPSWDIVHYVYFNYLLTRLWRHKFWNEPFISNQAVFSKWPKSQDKNLNILRTKRAF